jgi:4-hydroxy-tetrahydrodipicolinate reductase
MGPGNVPAHSVRAGEVIGDHVVSFFGKGDKIELAHFAQDRSIFARGAIDAALWLDGQKNNYQGTAPIGIEAFFKEVYRHGI